MPRIRIDTNALQAKSQELLAIADDQRQIIADVSNIISELMEYWDGEAFRAFVHTFEDAKFVYERFAPEMHGFANYMHNYALTMEYLDVFDPHNGLVDSVRTQGQ